MKDHRLTKNDLMNVLRQWSRFIQRKVRLIACGGTALTLIGIKESTKDVDFLIPEDNEYRYLVKILQDLGYGNDGGHKWKRKGGDEIYEFDLFPGFVIFTTELLESPLDKENHMYLFEIGKIYIGVLNFYDLIISKLMRGSTVDFEDCEMLYKAKKDEIELEKLTNRWKETLSYHPVGADRIKGHLDSFIDKIKR